MAEIYSLFSNTANAQTLEKRHIELCALDIMRVAGLMLKGREQGKDLHTDFVRHASFARRYNHEHYPDPAMDVEALYQDDYNDVRRNFREAFDNIHGVPRLQANDPGVREEIIQRVLSDSSPYLVTAMKWMDRALDTNGLTKYKLPGPASSLLSHMHLVTARRSGELQAIIENDMARLEECGKNPAAIPLSCGTLKPV